MPKTSGSLPRGHRHSANAGQVRAVFAATSHFGNVRQHGATAAFTVSESRTSYSLLVC